MFQSACVPFQTAHLAKPCEAPFLDKSFAVHRWLYATSSLSFRRLPPKTTTDACDSFEACYAIVVCSRKLAQSFWTWADADSKQICCGVPCSVLLFLELTSSFVAWGDTVGGFDIAVTFHRLCTKRTAPYVSFFSLVIIWTFLLQCALLSQMKEHTHVDGYRVLRRKMVRSSFQQMSCKLHFCILLSFSLSSACRLCAYHLYAIIYFVSILRFEKMQ